LSRDFVTTTLVLIGIAVGVAVLVYAAVYVGGSRNRAKRYRPGRPFVFTPVWFLSAPEKQARAGVVAGRELTAAPSAGGANGVVRPGETGGASDRW
jgi:hypothetical protein